MQTKGSRRRSAGLSPEVRSRLRQVHLPTVDKRILSHLATAFAPWVALGSELRDLEAAYGIPLEEVRRRLFPADELELDLPQAARLLEAEMMKELQLDLAGEYLLMAAMLAEIKSRMLLPRAEEEDDEEDDPRAELVRRLQEYERFKKAAEDLSSLPRLERDVFVASADAPERKVVTKMPDVTLKEILIAFHDVLRRAEMFSGSRSRTSR